MIDRDALLRFWLLDATGPVVALLGTPDRSIFVGSLPEKYDPRQTGQGMAIVIRAGGSGLSRMTGGGAHPEIPLINPRMQITVWAGENESDRAHTVDRAIMDWINRRENVNLGQFGYVLWCESDGLGQDHKDPQTKFATVVSFWQLDLFENLP